jgi:hypothetical protein
MDQSARTEFTVCTGVSLDPVIVCRPDESGCTTVTISDITEECGDCVSKRDAAYAEQYSLLDAYNVLKAQLTEYQRWRSMWTLAEAVRDAPGPVADWETNIVSWETTINSMNCIYLDRQTYWQQEASANRSKYSGTPSLSVVKSSSFGSDSNMVKMVDVRLRKLQIDKSYERSDKTLMLGLAGSEGPTRITMCSGNDLPGANLGGFQLFYGKFNPQAGPAHGNIRGDCTEHSLYDKVIQINFWIWAVNEYAGMEIVMTDYNDASATPKSITAGVTGDLTAARRQTIDFTSTDFFGFETKMDKTDRITNIDVVTYSSGDFYKWKSEAEATARTGLSANDWYDVEEQSARDADNWYDRYNGNILAINKA